jgi:hypothetical protein
MTHHLLAALAACSLVACASADGQRAPTSTEIDKPVDTTPTTDPNAALDPVDDPVPSGLPALSAHDKVKGVDVTPDISCFNKPLEVAVGTPATREFHLIELGGADSDRVGDAKVDLFVGNQIGNMPDVSTMTKKGEDMQSTGVFSAAVPAGFIAYRVNPGVGYVPVVGLDLEVPPTGAVLPAVPTQSKVDVLSVLIGGSAYEPTKGAGRAVVRVKDCKLNALANVHLVLEADGKVRKPSKSDGLRRSYFGDSELPGTGEWTSRSGVVAFLEIPAGAKNVRLVARGIVDGKPQVVAMRKIPLVADGLVAAKVMPFTAP